MAKITKRFTKSVRTLSKILKVEIQGKTILFLLFVLLHGYTDLKMNTYVGSMTHYLRRIT